jgi:hypothetical protein
LIRELKAKKNLTQCRLRPISPFSYVGRGRKGAKAQRKDKSFKEENEDKISLIGAMNFPSQILVSFVAFCKKD